MKILVLNASPKKSKSCTLKLTNAFLDGMGRENHEIEMLNICENNIEHCLGCFSCWKKTPGVCCIKDDMSQILDKIINSDMIIWSFPLYYFSVPSKMKALIDRQLPFNLPFMTNEDGGNGDNGAHPSRYDFSKKRYFFISTCGFYTTDGNYTGVNYLFDRMYGKGNYDKIICAQGELFNVPELKKRTDKYLEVVKQAGFEYANSSISESTRNELSKTLYPRETFEKMADASWGVERDGEKADNRDNSHNFTVQMSALYNKNSWNGKDKVLEMEYTDINKSYQIVLTKEGSIVKNKDFIPFTTKIKTPYNVWCDIASGKISGQEALMKHLYTVDGDFDLMLNWDKYFGEEQSQDNHKENKIKKVSSKKTNMTLMLLPWMSIWIAMGINQTIGEIIGISLCALLPILFMKFKPTIFEGITSVAVTATCFLSMLGCPMQIYLPLSYLAFGLMWSVTVFCKLPLTAYYSMNDYGGENMLENLLFLKTNRILTAVWGVLYLITPIWTYFLVLSPYQSFVGAINSVLPILIGIFTAWFQKWYPAYFARKRK